MAYGYATEGPAAAITRRRFVSLQAKPTKAAQQTVFTCPFGLRVAGQETGYLRTAHAAKRHANSSEQGNSSAYQKIKATASSRKIVKFAQTSPPSRVNRRQKGQLLVRPEKTRRRRRRLLLPHRRLNRRPKRNQRRPRKRPKQRPPPLVANRLVRRLRRTRPHQPLRLPLKRRQRRRVVTPLRQPPPVLLPKRTAGNRKLVRRQPKRLPNIFPRLRQLKQRLLLVRKHNPRRKLRLLKKVTEAHAAVRRLGHRPKPPHPLLRRRKLHQKVCRTPLPPLPRNVPPCPPPFAH